MSTLKTNTLTGTTSAGSINVTGEGGSTTTNLQQGLCKAWFRVNGTGTPAFTDNFNGSSVTDNGTGDYTVTVTNNMGNANYVSATEVRGGTSSDGSERSISGMDGSTARSSSVYRFRHVYHSTTSTKYDDQYNNILHIGDLA